MSLNPYRIAVKEIARRVFWDLHPQAWISRSRMNEV